MLPASFRQTVVMCIAHTHTPTMSITNTDASSTRSSLIDLSAVLDPSTVDFVLVWRPHADHTIERQHQAHRTMFEERLCAEGLLLDETAVDDLFYVKVFAPDDLLHRYAEVLRLRMPIKPPATDTDADRVRFKRRPSWLPRPLQLPGLRQRLHALFGPDYEQFPDEPAHFTAVYSRERDHLFDRTHRNWFTASVRSRIVAFILDRKRYRPAAEDPSAFGIRQMLAAGLYVAAYPLHDGDEHSSPERSMRRRLLEHWACMSKWWRWQPLDAIKRYLGVKVGMYFSWIGFYTWMLSVAAAVGTACFAYAVLAAISDDRRVREICDSTVMMCPACDRYCDYWPLASMCWSAKLARLFDNEATVFLAAFMSMWATLFLTLWQRYAAELKQRWHLNAFDADEEQPRPQFLARLTMTGDGGGRWWRWRRRGQLRLRQNPVTRALEPEALFWRDLLPARLLSGSVVVLMMALAAAAVVGVLLYRLAVVTSFGVYGPAGRHDLAVVLATISAAVLNLLFIMLFDLVRWI